MDSVLTALRGESQLIVRPTSAGKSLCFQRSAVLRGQPTTFVLCPLKTLMVEQTEKLQARGLPASPSTPISQAPRRRLATGSWSRVHSH